MRIGLISDTHIPEVAQELPRRISEVFKDVDLILHAGDICATGVLDSLNCIAPVLAARGDDDFRSILQDERVKNIHVLKLENQTLWLVHERPFTPEWYSNSSIPQECKDEIPDIVVFGHKHDESIKRQEGILFLKPGSATFLEYVQGPGTVGILEINSSGVDAFTIWL